jgi:phosphoglycolate phosphatase
MEGSKVKHNLCLFDLDGTLTDPKVGITKSISYALDSFGIHVENLDDLKKFIGPPLRDSFREYYNFSVQESEKAVSKFREYFSDTGIFENTLYDGIIEMLARLKDKKIMLVIATSKPTVYAEKIAEHFKFKKYFEFIVGSELDGTRSRKSEVINYIINEVDPERKKSAVMIGDREHDIIGGRETGMDSIGITWGYGSNSELEKAKATWIVNSPDELFNCIMGEHI